MKFSHQVSVKVNYCVSYRSSTQQVPKVCAALITTGPNDLFPFPPLPPHALHPPGNFKTTLHILLPPKPYPRPYLTSPLHSPRRFSLALLQGHHPEASPKRFYPGKACFFVHFGSLIPFLSCLPPWLPKQNIPSTWLWGHLPCSSGREEYPQNTGAS